MGVDMGKMRKSKGKDKSDDKARRARANVNWDSFCKYDGTGSTIGLEHDGLEHSTDKSALLWIEGDKYWVPFSQIRDADDEAVIVTEWWWGKAEPVE